jgi:predicted RNA-binding Zn-ribbon protein involved in translation (DUF1610 family)
MGERYDEIHANHRHRHAHNTDQPQCLSCNSFISERAITETDTAIRWLCARCGTNRQFIR